MIVTVCELDNSWTDSDDKWNSLREHLGSVNSELLLLPEMAFSKWLAASPDPDPAQWQKAVEAHDRWIGRLPELGVPAVIGTRAVLENGRPQNQGYTWHASRGYQFAHTKYYLPDETGFWEASWYERGKNRFEPVAVAGLRIGFAICTEIWFMAKAREYATQGVHLLVCPRATPAPTTDKWIAGGRAAAVVAGAYCLSSNFNGFCCPELDFGGTGWIIGPDGDLLGLTSAQKPYLSLEIDPAAAEAAKKTYPRYVLD